MKAIVDKFLLEDFVEYLISEYDIMSAQIRWVSHGTSAPHSFRNKANGKIKMIQEIAEEYAIKRGFELPDVYESKFVNSQ